jgi:transcriptional regulator with XRE-family HTH domain
MEIKQKIKSLRKSKGLTQKQFAKIVSVSAYYVSDIETGRRKPSMVLQQLIIAVYKLNKNYF